MRSFSRLDRVLFAVGLLIFLSSTYLFAFQADRLAAYFGYSDEGGNELVGKVALKKNMVRRKFNKGNEFFPLNEDQAIYAHDYVMTGAESGMVLGLLDGSTIELAADTLVEIQVKDAGNGFDSSFMLYVQKGKVTGTAKSVTVIQDGAVMALPNIQPDSLAAYLAEPQKVQELRRCRVDQWVVLSPINTPDALPHVRGEMICNAQALTQSVQVRNESGNVIYQAELELKPNLHADFDFAVKEPGNYTFIPDQTTQNNKTIPVPAAFEVLSWGNPAIRCDRGVNFLLPSLLTEKTQLLTDSGEVVRSKSSSLSGQFINITDEELSLPKKIRVELLTQTDFKLQTPLLAVDAWRVCPALKLPQNKSKISKDASSDLVFTWAEHAIDDTYDFQISDREDFSNLIQEQSTDKHFIKVSIEKKGRYFWRVKNKATQEVSVPSEFEVK